MVSAGIRFCINLKRVFFVFRARDEKVVFFLSSDFILWNRAMK